MQMYVVYGAPCSGKTTWVKSQMTEKSVVYDYDRLIEALTNRQQHITEKSVAHGLALMIQSTLLRWLHEMRYKDGQPDIDSAYIIISWPHGTLQEKVSGLAQYIFIDAPLEKCLNNLAKDNSRPDKEKWERIITDWFKQHGTATQDRR